jgi:hypothetical protein
MAFGVIILFVRDKIAKMFAVLYDLSDAQVV